MLAEGHSRLSSPLYNLTFTFMALAAVLGAAFNRFGYGRRIAITAVLAVVVRVAGFGVQAAAAGADWLNVFQYAVPIGVMVVCALMVFQLRLPRPGPVPASLGGALAPAGRA